MQTKMIATLVGVVLLAVAAFSVYRGVEAQRPKGSDETQIRQMLADGEAAAERGQPGGIEKFISPDYEDGLGMSDSSVRYQIRRYLNEHPGMDVTIPGEKVVTHVDSEGKTGSVQFELQLNTQVGGQPVTQVVPMSLKLAKEKVSYYWVFPGQEWRVTGADGYGGLETGF